MLQHVLFFKHWKTIFLIGWLQASGAIFRFHDYSVDQRIHAESSLEVVPTDQKLYDFASLQSGARSLCLQGTSNEPAGENVCSILAGFQTLDIE